MKIKISAATAKNQDNESSGRIGPSVGTDVVRVDKNSNFIHNLCYLYLVNGEIILSQENKILSPALVRFDYNKVIDNHILIEKLDNINQLNIFRETLFDRINMFSRILVDCNNENDVINIRGTL